MTDSGALTNREIAVVAWSTALLLWLVLRKNVGPTLIALLRGALNPKLLVPMVLFGAWVGAAVWGASQIGAWNPALVKDTIVWAVVAGFSLFSKFIQVGEPRLFRRMLLASIAIPELIGFILGIVSFALWFEFLFVPVIASLVLLSAAASFDPDSHAVMIASDRTLAVIGLLLVIGTGVHVAFSIPEINWEHEVLAFYVPIWLTAWSLPFVFALGTYSRFEDAFIRVDLGAKDQRVRRRAKAALLLHFGLRVDLLDEFARTSLHRLLRARDFTEARSIAASPPQDSSTGRSDG